MPIKSKKQKKLMQKCNTEYLVRSYEPMLELKKRVAAGLYKLPALPGSDLGRGDPPDGDHRPRRHRRAVDRCRLQASLMQRGTIDAAAVTTMLEAAGPGLEHPYFGTRAAWDEEHRRLFFPVMSELGAWSQQKFFEDAEFIHAPAAKTAQASGFIRAIAKIPNHLNERWLQLVRFRGWILRAIEENDSHFLLARIKCQYFLMVGSGRAHVPYCLESMANYVKQSEATAEAKQKAEKTAWAAYAALIAGDTNTADPVRRSCLKS